MKKFLIATHNKGKFKEYQIIFDNFLKGIETELVSLTELGIKDEVEETGKDYKENAILKAEFYSQFTDLPILADDAGLEIEFFEGWPGVKSRRIPGYTASDEELVKIIMDKMQGIPFEKRRAKYRVVIAIKDKEIIYTFEGERKGFIIEKEDEKIWEGLPFDSIFYLPEKKDIFIKLGREEKADLSHRRVALEKALPFLKKILT